MRDTTGGRTRAFSDERACGATYKINRYVRAEKCKGKRLLVISVHDVRGRQWASR